VNIGAWMEVAESCFVGIIIFGPSPDSETRDLPY
jgi:hypothetical protein